MSSSPSWKPEQAWQTLQEAEPPEWVLQHTRHVVGLAQAMADRAAQNGHAVDAQLVLVGALLHDLGRAITQDVKHASIGAAALRDLEAPEPICRIVERHTGGGIDPDEAAALGLPVKDYTPQTLEEKIVCHADNLYSGPRRLSLDDLERKYQAKDLPRAWKKIQALHAELTGILGADPQRLENVPYEPGT